MSRQGTIRRYTLIIDKLKSNQFPSFNTIKNYLFEHGFEISSRTIQRDIEQIRYEFGIEILYNRFKNGYYINYEDSINIESFFKFLEIVNTAELLTDSLIESKDALKYFLFENQGSLKGLEHLKEILQAVRERRIISFSYLSYITDQIKKYSLKPYLIKEYQDRWYIIGILENSNEFRTFGIDRIEKLKLKSKIFLPDKNINAAKLFEDIIGLNYSGGKIEKVVLSFTCLQGKYIKSLPIHKSQKILIDNSEEFRIELNIIPNYELIQKIMFYGDAVKILKPKWLMLDIKERFKKALENYS